MHLHRHLSRVHRKHRIHVPRLHPARKDLRMQEIIRTDLPERIVPRTIADAMAEMAVTIADRADIRVTIRVTEMSAVSVVSSSPETIRAADLRVTDPRTTETVTEITDSREIPVPVSRVRASAVVPDRVRVTVVLTVHPEMEEMEEMVVTDVITVAVRVVSETRKPARAVLVAKHP